MHMNIAPNSSNSIKDLFPSNKFFKFLKKNSLLVCNLFSKTAQTHSINIVENPSMFVTNRTFLNIYGCV